MAKLLNINIKYRVEVLARGKFFLGVVLKVGGNSLVFFEFFPEFFKGKFLQFWDHHVLRLS